MSLALAATGGGARAADPEALIREGIELRRAGDDATALKKFQQAYDLGKTPKAIAQVALAEQALGRWAAADTHLHQALKFGDDPWIQKYRTAIDQALAVVSTHIGRLDVRGIPTGADVRVDGELVGRLPLPAPIAVTAGGVAIEVRAPGYLPIARTTMVAAGLLTRENFTLQPLAPVAGEPAGPPPRIEEPSASGGGQVAPPTSSAPGFAQSSSPPGPANDAAGTAASPPGSGGRGILVLGAAGLAAISLAFGVVEQLSWQHKVSSFDSMSNCGGSLPDKGSPGCKQLYQDGQNARLLAFVGYGAGATFAAAALILYLTDSPAVSDARRVACATTLVTPGLACALRF